MKTCLRTFLILSLLTGLLYPLTITCIAKLVFPYEAGGSLVVVKDKIYGSRLIGQGFAREDNFWSRPSATAPFPYNAAASSGSNLGPTNPDLVKAITERVKKIRSSHGDEMQAIPVDLVTSSASGLDPQISLAAAKFQIRRVARVRGIGEQELASLVDRFTERRTFGFLGEPGVNVLLLNLALDGRM